MKWGVGNKLTVIAQVWVTQIYHSCLQDQRWERTPTELRGQGSQISHISPSCKTKSNFNNLVFKGKYFFLRQVLGYHEDEV